MADTLARVRDFNRYGNAGPGELVLVDTDELKRVPWCLEGLEPEVPAEPSPLDVTPAPDRGLDVDVPTEPEQPGDAVPPPPEEGISVEGEPSAAEKRAARKGKTK